MSFCFNNWRKLCPPEAFSFSGNLWCYQSVSGLGSVKKMCLFYEKMKDFKFLELRSKT